MQIKWIERFQSYDVQASEEVQWPDLEDAIATLKASLSHVLAGGGVVLNSERALLMIHRRGFWDLPKGKQETGEVISETALREVEEECGIAGLKLCSNAPISTFHFYKETDRVILKESVWFLMEVEGVPPLTPQVSEDILEAKWVPLPVPLRLQGQTYQSIVEVLNTFSLSEVAR